MSDQEMQGHDAPVIETKESGWKAQQVYLMALACLMIGVAIGYLLRGSASPAAPTATTASASQPAASPHGDMGGQMPTLERMKKMADTAAAPALDKLKQNPNDFQTLNDLGKLYRSTHQFKEAASYYERALAVEPKNAAARTDLASCLYYEGDVDGALAQLDKALQYDPQFFGALLNSGIIKLKAKNDTTGAIASWEKILKSNADPKQKEAAKKLIASARQAAGSGPKG